MKRGALANLFIGLSIALLPIYTRITIVDYNRTCKDNLLVTLLGAACIILPSAVRKMNAYMWAFMIYGLSFLVMNQDNVLSLNVVMQTMYISMGFVFFANYYERHEAESLYYVLYGMMFGSVIQGIFTIAGYFNLELYYMCLQWLLDIKAVIHSSGGGAVNAVGTLGNSNLSASYLCMTIPAFFFAPKKLWVLALVPLTALALTHSFMGISSLLAGVLYYINTEKKIFAKWHFYLGAIAGMIALPFLPLNVDNGRFEPWKILLNLVDTSHLIIGKGAGWFADKKIFIPKAEVYFQQEHNAFLTLFNVYGLVGFLLLSPIFIKFLMSEDRNKIFSTILFVAFCNSYGHFSLHQSTVVIIILVAACVCLAEEKSNVINLDR